MIAFLCLLMAGPYYFSNATVYEPDLHSLKEGVYLLIDAQGKVATRSGSPIPVSDTVTEVPNALILPHYADFYCLIQERGLGLDEDMDLTNQARMARYLRRIGVQTLRDPVFPPIGLSPVMDELLAVRAARGYLETEDGPGASFCRVIKSTDELLVVGEMVDDESPVCFWWSRHGTQTQVTWPKQAERLRALIRMFKERGQKVGAFIQDAGAEELEQLASFDFDFYEGIPAAKVDVTRWKGIVWVPLASMNDKRYCATWFEERIRGLTGLGLYDEAERRHAEGVAASAKERIRDRCSSWRGEREVFLEPVRVWLKQGGKLALGSAGGHLFSFSGDLRSELTVLEELGATQTQILEAAFATTPNLLKAKPYSVSPGALANCIVYKQAGGYWAEKVGTPVFLNYREGRLEEPVAPLPLIAPKP